jgi:hypothetical protein
MVLCCAALLFSLPAQKRVDPGEWVYDALAVLSLEQGIVFFADSVLTIGQIERMLTEIDEEALSPSGKLLYARVDSYLHSSAWLSYQGDALTLGVDMAVWPELYFKTNSELKWTYDHHYRQPLFIAPLSLSFGPYITIEMDPYFGENEYAASLHDNYTNIPFDLAPEVDIHFPKHAYLSVGVPFGKASGVHFAIGIGDNFFGRTRTGSILLSDYMEKVGYAELSLFSPFVKYAAKIMQLEVNKYLYMHYLHMRPHKRVSVSAMEGVMVNAPLELRFLNPLMIFHSMESWETYGDYNADLAPDAPAEKTGASRAGSFFGAKIEYQPWNHVRLYGLFGITQLQLGVEHDRWEEDLTPDALGFQAGAEFSMPVPQGYWTFGLEGVYTYPYMYVKYDKGWSYYRELAEVDRLTVRYWTGTPFGPDSIAGTLWAGYHHGAQWSLEGSFLFLAQGENSGTDIFDDDGYRVTHEVADVVRPPTGIPTYTYTVTLLGKWSPVTWLNVSLQPAYTIVQNHGHSSDTLEQGFEIILSIQIKPPFKRL